MYLNFEYFVWWRGGFIASPISPHILLLSQAAMSLNRLSASSSHSML